MNILNLPPTHFEDLLNGRNLVVWGTGNDIANVAYQVARKYCDSHGIKIRNATRGGSLEIFERVDFDSLFGVQ